LGELPAGSSPKRFYGNGSKKKKGSQKNSAPNADSEESTLRAEKFILDYKKIVPLKHLFLKSKDCLEDHNTIFLHTAHCL
jgi:hypothetical protein